MPPPSSSSLKIYLRLLSHVRPFAGLFLISILGYLIFSSAQPMLAGILKYFVDGLASEASMSRYTFPLVGGNGTGLRHPSVDCHCDFLAGGRFFSW